jgi:putative membrane protein
MNTYLIFKSLHLIAVISWMAGLLYLPRIFVYHAENMNKEEICTVFKTMERKLYNYIMMPAMLLSWIFGLILISYTGIETLSVKWLQIKFILVILLSIYHFYLGSLLLKFNENNNTKSSKFYRWLNELPTLLLIFIVFIVIFKPI